jgi:NADP-dependent 3-hydroxy acid dehydrogenase YdfG
MQKDTPTLFDKGGAEPVRGLTAGHARQARYAPLAPGGKAGTASRPRTVLVTPVSKNTDDPGASCVAMLAGAGHRVVALMADDCMSSVLGVAIASGRVVTMPVCTTDAASIRKAIKGLSAPFRSVDAVVNIMHRQAGRPALLDADTPAAELLTRDELSRLLAATRAAVPGLLANERGHVIAMTLTSRHESSALTDYGPADALCASLRAELDDLGIRFTRIAAGPIEHTTGVNGHRENRPRTNGMPRGALSLDDVAEAVAWTLAQPSHVAVCDIDIAPAPRSRPMLSPRERQVLEWTACGKTSEEISCILELSVSAVNFHVKSLMAKLQCCNKTAAVARAALLGLLI